MNDLQEFRKFFRVAAVVASLTSVLFSFAFGMEQSSKLVLWMACALFFSVCSFASDYILLFVRQAFRSGQTALGIGLSAGFVGVFALNMIGHLGSVSTTRRTEIRSSLNTQVNEKDAREEVRGLRAAIELSAGRLANIEGNLKASEVWSTVASPSGLAEQVKSMEGDRIYARSRQCSNVTIDESRKFCDKLAGIRARLGDIQVADELRKELREAREKHEMVVAKSQRVAKDTKLSASVEQAGMFASFLTVSLEPDEKATEWTVRGMGFVLALALCGCPILFALIGWPDEGSAPSLPPSRPVQDGENIRQTIVQPVEVRVTSTKVEEQLSPIANPTVVPLPPRRLQFVGDSGFTRRLAGIIKSRELAA